MTSCGGNACSTRRASISRNLERRASSRKCLVKWTESGTLLPQISSFQDTASVHRCKGNKAHRKQCRYCCESRSVAYSAPCPAGGRRVDAATRETTGRASPQV